MRALFLALLFLGVSAAPALGDDTFAAMDADGDGRVTWEEFTAAHPSLKRAAFDAIDRDGDGHISPEEWQAFRQTHGKQVMPMPHRPLPGAGADMPLIRPPKGSE